VQCRHKTVRPSCRWADAPGGDVQAGQSVDRKPQVGDGNVANGGNDDADTLGASRLVAALAATAG
jgi:hypothetical protein